MVYMYLKYFILENVLFFFKINIFIKVLLKLNSFGEN